MAVAFGRGCGCASGRLLGATGPRMESYNWKAAIELSSGWRRGFCLPPPADKK